MNNKGFTLVELLAVIVITSVLTLITSVSVVGILKTSKNRLNNVQINSIKAAAQAWGADNIILLPDADNCIYLTLSIIHKNI